MKSILTLLSLLVLVPQARVAAQQPNIVVLLADDLGWNAVGYHNDEFQTANIDSIASNGLELDRFYVAPMCSPTRAGFMTGRYPIRFGLARAVIPPQRDFGLPPSETTIGEMLGQFGYEHRAVFGKWHLGHRRAKWHPLAQGFTHFHGHYNGAIDYFELTREETRDWHVGYEPSDEQGYATDLIADAAADWITRQAKADSPYFCYVPFNAPHSPFQAPDEAIAKYGSLSGDASKSEEYREIYKAMIGRMDEGIGQILDAIESSGEADNTIVWFFSDNGGVSNLKNLNTPLRGAKLTVYDGGIRVPACVRWPAKIQPGRKSEFICGYIDLLPTLVSIAGHNASTMSAQPLDGIDLTDLLTGEADKTSDRAWYSYHGQGGEEAEHLAVIESGWKLKVNGPRLTSVDQLTDDSRQIELFQISTDPLEENDVKDHHPEMVRKLGELLVQHRTLQPKRSVPRYRVGKAGFVPPKNWKLDPEYPNKLVGSSKK
ncbi:arylsulfatase B [Rhodopirellula maiorica SM1]|uniref:Arylsulfatase B n=1 Tax=Rhodopirellula maiorica SM1 TaxID=1265738 RepID=M5RHD2_9BACT|nr:sulfatase-like hydrolase/transferase [Rhodopirellula maiorica]EMI18773.1 arylsulfatase B [Rhodopirellula maiorica SM1]